MRCGGCGARNSDDATWCTQCYAPFHEPASDTLPSEAAAAPASDPPIAASPSDPDASAPAQRTSDDIADGAATSASSSAGPSSPSAEHAERDVREIDGRVEWRCPTCASWVVLEDPACATCGAARVGFGDPATPTAAVPDAAEQTLLGASAVLPGAGHLLVGRIGSGITRAALFLLWAVGGLWWILSTQDGRSPGVVLLGGALVLWGTTLVDVNAIAKRRTSEPFGVRGLLWMVVGVTGLLMLMVAFAAAGSLGS